MTATGASRLAVAALAALMLAATGACADSPATGQLTFPPSTPTSTPTQGSAVEGATPAARPTETGATPTATRASPALSGGLAAVTPGAAVLPAAASPTPSPTPSPPASPGPTSTATPGSAGSATPTATRVLGPVATASPTPTATASPTPTERPTPRTPTVVLDGVPFFAEIADTPGLRSRGLSGRDRLAAQTGMLFIFESGATSSFWMSGMRFPLDFVWIAADCTVADITLDVPHPDPETPTGQLTIYRSSAAAAYTFEINAGETETHGIELGAPVRFMHIESELEVGCQ